MWPAIQNISTSIISKLSASDVVLFLMLVGSWTVFYFILKILWNAYKDAQEKRIGEGKEFIKVQNSTISSIENLTRVVELVLSVKGIDKK